MSEKIQGIISFINHEKQYAMIEYEEKNKKKTVRAAIDEKTQQELKDKKQIKKLHHFMTGDVVSFQIKLSGRGDRMMATGTAFLYNNALDILINKSKINNRFTGYLKLADDKVFVKEIESYLFFPVPFSPWQLLPTEEELNEAVDFKLENINKKEKIYAALLNNKYIPEFLQAVKLMKARTPVNATVARITAHSVYVDIIGNKIQAKLPADKTLKTGDEIKVLITYIGRNKIAIEKIPALQQSI